MESFSISEEEIIDIEKMLLPLDCHFEEDAKDIIRYWKSTDVIACPGSGKTTVLLAKLKVLADKMPFSDNSGVCVLSHTNVAVNEIKSKLSHYSHKLLNFPNYVGTIQSFIDQFVTKPYLKKYTDKPIQVIDNEMYSILFSRLIWKIESKDSPYNQLRWFIKTNYQNSEKFFNELEYIQNLMLKDGSLYIKGQQRYIAGKNSHSAQQYYKAQQELLKEEGIIRYEDAFKYAKEVMNNFSDSYFKLFSKRFKYVFIDEYQDCSLLQRELLDKLFDKENSCVFCIGDPDQSIYNSIDKEEIEWIPKNECFEMGCSNRYGQEIANVLVNLRSDKRYIKSKIGNTKYKPTLIVFDKNTRNKVIDSYISALNQNQLTDPNGIYKVIGLVKKEELKGLKIGDYWEKYNSRINSKAYDKY